MGKYTQEPSNSDCRLNILDLISWGLANRLGYDLYWRPVLMAYIIGPGSVVSFLIAAVASSLSALCYAELASKMPQAGSAYLYSYITVGMRASSCRRSPANGAQLAISQLS